LIRRHTSSRTASTLSDTQSARQRSDRTSSRPKSDVFEITATDAERTQAGDLPPEVHV
jgi:hypothetical protein